MIYTESIFIANDTDAHFRGWTKWVHDRLLAFGWVQTADTGQMDFATVLAPTTSNQVRGYTIYRMDDALQATAPVYMKIEFGSGSSNVANPAIFITMGSGTTGAGLLTGNVTFRSQETLAGYTAGPLNCFASGDAGRFTIALGADPVSTNAFFVFGVERLRDPSGSPLNTGAHLVQYHTTPAFSGGVKCSHQVLTLIGGAVPLIETALTGDMPNPNQTSGTFANDTYLYAIKPQWVYPRNPSLNFIAYYNADFLRELPVDVEAYGTLHKFMPLGTGGLIGGVNPPVDKNSNVNARVMMRYE